MCMCNILQQVACVNRSKQLKQHVRAALYHVNMLSSERTKAVLLLQIEAVVSCGIIFGITGVDGEVGRVEIVAELTYFIVQRAMFFHVAS